MKALSTTIKRRAAILLASCFVLMMMAVPAFAQDIGATAQGAATSAVTAGMIVGGIILAGVLLYRVIKRFAS